MGTAARRVHHAYAEYLALEDESPIRHEYLDGEIYAMAGGSPDHAALAAAVIGILRAGLPPGCRAFTSDLRVRVRPLEKFSVAEFGWLPKNTARTGSATKTGGRLWIAAR